MPHQAKESGVMAKLIIRLAIAIVCLSPGSGWADWHYIEAEKMGTRVEVQLWHEDSENGRQLLAMAMDEFDRIERLMSTYIDSSEISRVNSLAAIEPQEVSAELFDLLQLSQEVSALTEGAFDISFDSVGVLYDFRKKQRPNTIEIASELEKVNYRLVELDDEAKTVSFASDGVRINLGGIAKGHAVERVIELLAAEGVRHALATAGGDTRLLGDRRGQPWVVGIRDPDRRDAVFTRLALDNEAISTSGDYERYFIDEGKRYHHILSPQSGNPVQGVRSVSVIGPDATMTDGLSTSVFVLGPEKGLAVIESLADYEAVIITEEKLFYSNGLESGE